MFGRHLLFDQLWDFFPKIQIWEDRCKRSDDVDSHTDALIYKASSAFRLHGPDGQAIYMEIACIRSTIRRIIPLVRMDEALI
jgi:hypothetical protein